jgi:acetoin utilization deacetylase AcuC-like enzyme
LQDCSQSLLNPQEGARTRYAQIDPDTAMNKSSWSAVLRSVGATLAATDAVMSGDLDNAFCAVRPPGHHAERDRAMGFCVFNNIAVAALHARVVHGVERIAVVDFDVHHGNGTEAMFASDEDLLYISSHQWPLYPGTGNPRDRGLGNILNLGLRPGSGSAEFRAAMSETALPLLEAFRPGLVLVSAGFDGHADDPLAELDLLEADYAWITERLVAVAAASCQGRLVSTLEGGYNLRALATSAAAHVRALMAA